ncbi:MAG: pantoate--beta-alanine ligase [Chitinophagaceae bacterium]|nr:pantoate--beta-alanine ligase [Chitinophagaceae bacterium]
MVLFKKSAALQKWLGKQRKKGKIIGFVPTMGALHDGHLSLIEASKKHNSITVSSIFVNPTQFNDPADFEKYPITLEKDIQLLEQADCDVLFLPSVSEIYPEWATANEQYDLGYLETILEGKYRPGHFQGVCKVVKRLLEKVQPGNLYLGQKDYQQCMVITKLTELMGWKNTMKVNICPTLREPDGLAMSSRNMRLDKEEREKAPAIYRALTYIKSNLQKGDLQPVKVKALQMLVDQGFKPDYIEIADAATLQLSNEWDGRQKLVTVAAAFLNEVRLIDNLLLND